MNQTQPAPESLPFDKRAADQARQFANELIASTPELRGVAVVFDYTGDLNDANVNAAIWQARDGQWPYAALVGVTMQTLKLLDVLHARLSGMLVSLREELVSELTKAQQLAANQHEDQPSPSQGT